MPKALTQADIVQRLKDRGSTVTVIGTPVTANVSIEFNCQEHGEVWQTPKQALYNATGCVKCGEARKGPRVKIESVGDMLATKHNGTIVLLTNLMPFSKCFQTFQCTICTHEWKAEWDRVYRMGHGCRKCAYLTSATKKIATAASRYTDYLQTLEPKIKLLEPYISAITPILHQCAKGHTFTVMPHVHKRDSTLPCPRCWETGPKAYSKSSIAWLDWIHALTGIDILHAENGGEQCLLMCDGTKVWVDGFAPDTNTVYEFHGDKYHGNPKLYAADDQCHPFNDAKASELYKATKRKESLIRRSGFKLAIIWESDWR